MTKKLATAQTAMQMEDWFGLKLVSHILHSKLQGTSKKRGRDSKVQNMRRATKVFSAYDIVTAHKNSLYMWQCSKATWNWACECIILGKGGAKLLNYSTQGVFPMYDY